MRILLTSESVLPKLSDSETDGFLMRYLILRLTRLLLTGLLFETKRADVQCLYVITLNSVLSNNN